MIKFISTWLLIQKYFECAFCCYLQIFMFLAITGTIIADIKVMLLNWCI